MAHSAVPILRRDAVTRKLTLVAILALLASCATTHRPAQCRGLFEPINPSHVTVHHE